MLLLLQRNIAPFWHHTMPGEGGIHPISSAIKPKVFEAPEDRSKHGQMSRVILSILRTARHSTTMREIVMERGLPAMDKLLQLLTKRVQTALRALMDRGQAVSQPGPGFHQLWEIVR